MTKVLRGLIHSVPVEDIPENGLHLIFEDISGVLAETEECRIQDTAKGEVFLQRVDGDVHVNGNVAAMISIRCDRCLEEYNQKIDTSFFYTLVPSQSLEGKKEIALDKEDMEVSFYDGAEIQIGEIFREQILLQIPMRHVCREDCKGICSGCGADLNIEKCRCRSEILDNPFSVLKVLNQAVK
ncbi:MAG: hypothetical protein AVO38_14075 [delta proteobacterium ML8_D]|jgi:uncharacterized protein|nr:MAG: hypothetical protein AVO38_14075 [delta proteobacterium ML8_D]